MKNDVKIAKRTIDLRLLLALISVFKTKIFPIYFGMQRQAISGSEIGKCKAMNFDW